MKKYLLTIILFILIIPTIVMAGTCNPNDIEIKSVTLSKILGTGEEVSSVNVDNKNINLDVKLNSPSDYMEYTIKVKNNGTEDYYIKEQDFNNDQYLKYEFVHEDDSFKVEPGEEKEITLRVSYIDRVEGNANYTSTDTLTLNIIDNQTVKVVNTLKNLRIATVILIIITLVSIFIGGGILFNNKTKNLLLILIGIAILIPIYANASCDATIDVDVRVELDNKNAMFDVGIEVNKKIKTLAGNTLDDSKPIFNKVNYDAHITSVVRSTVEPESSNKETKNIVSAQDSELPIYMWYDSGTLYWWSEDETPSLNPDSNEFFVGLTKVTNLDTVSKFDVSTANSIEDFFYHCEKLPNIEFLENWNVSNITNFNWLLCSIEVNLDLSPIANWDVSNAVSLEGTFEDLEATDDFSPVSNWNISNVTNLSYTFECCYSLTDLSFLTNWDISNVVTIDALFCDCLHLTDLTPIADWDTRNVTDMSYAFCDAEELTDLSPIANWNVTCLKNAEGIFYYMTALEEVDLSRWDTSNVTNMSYLFADCTSLSNIEGLRNLNLSKVTNAQNMFAGCVSITSLEPVEHWNVSSLKKAYAMFDGLSKITSADFSNWNVSNVDNFAWFMAECAELQTIDITGWNTPNLVYTYSMLRDNPKLHTITGLGNINTSKLLSINNMFTNDVSLTTLDLHNWNTTKLETMSEAFIGCTNLTSLNLVGWNTPNLKKMTSAFKNTALTTLDLSTFNTKLVVDFNQVFNNISTITTIYIGENWDTSANTATDTYIFPYSCNLPNFSSSNENYRSLAWAKPTTEGGYLTLKTND